MIIFIFLLIVFSVLLFIAAGKKAKAQKGRTLVKVTRFAEETKHKSGIGRAAVGGALFGVGGAVVGAATAKDKDYVTFKAEYSNGAVEFHKVRSGSTAYKIWINNMQMLEKNVSQ